MIILYNYILYDYTLIILYIYLYKSYNESII